MTCGQVWCPILGICALHLLKAHHGGGLSLSISVSLTIARNLKVHWHMHPFVQIQVVMLRLCYVSKLSD